MLNSTTANVHSIPCLPAVPLKGVTLGLVGVPVVEAVVGRIVEVSFGGTPEGDDWVTGTRDELGSRAGVSVGGPVAVGPGADTEREIPMALQRLLVKAMVSGLPLETLLLREDCDSYSASRMGYMHFPRRVGAN